MIDLLIRLNAQLCLEYLLSYDVQPCRHVVEILDVSDKRHRNIVRPLVAWLNMIKWTMWPIRAFVSPILIVVLDLVDIFIPDFHPRLRPFVNNVRNFLIDSRYGNWGCSRWPFHGSGSLKKKMALDTAMHKSMKYNWTVTRATSGKRSAFEAPVCDWKFWLSKIA